MPKLPTLTSKIIIIIMIIVINIIIVIIIIIIIIIIITITPDWPYGPVRGLGGEAARSFWIAAMILATVAHHDLPGEPGEDPFVGYPTLPP